jgi:signal transduction histidine kinase
LELDDLHKRSKAIVAQYEALSLANERESVRDLSSNTEAYWQFLNPALSWTASERNRQGQHYLRDFVAPHRKDLIKLVNDVNKMNVRDADAEEQRIRELQERSQKRVTAIFALTFALAGGLALSVIWRVRTLERDVSRRFAELQEARSGLRRLSDRLVRAQEEERRNLSRELHDEMGQSMSAMLMELSRLESKLAMDEQSHKMFASVRELAESSVAKLRDLSLALRPAMLDELGLLPALRWQAREVARRTGLKVEVVAADDDDDLPDAYRTCIYRVVQEALHNVVRHAHASQVRVTMNRGKDGVTVSIADSGVGFDPKREKGLGLLGIAERVNQLGGDFQIESRPGGGTVASLFLPVPAPATVAAAEPVA